MRFRDPETGKVYEDISEAADHYCVTRGCRCEVCAFTPLVECTAYPEEHPREAAERMGFEVIEEGDNA